jgi:hypothetical protein
MNIGFSKIDITPPLGTRMAGQPMNYVAKGVESRLFATSMCLSHGSERIVLVSCDLVMLSNETISEITAKAEKQFSIPAESIILCVTHTHSGPITQAIFGMDADDSYLKQLNSNILLSIELSLKNCVPAEFYFTKAQLDGFAFNRRFIMSDGNIETHPLKGDPHIVKSEGPDSNDLSVFYACDINDVPLGAIVVFGCHATVMERDNELISSDYAGKVARYVSDKLGQNVPVLFLQGASGNICQVNPMDKSKREVGLGWTEVMGKAVGQKAIDVLNSKKKKASGSLRIFTETIEIPRRSVDPEILRWAKNYKDIDCEMPVLSDYGVEHFDEIKPPKVSLEQLFKTPYWANFYANEIRTLDKDKKKQPQMPLVIKVIAQDNWAMVTLPCELFVEWSEKIYAKSPFEYTTVVELANGWNGYIPTKVAFERKGGYETKDVTSTMLVPEAGEMVLKTVLDMLNEAKKSVNC